MFAEWLDLFQKGGFVMYPILLCSIAGVAIFAERMMFYREHEGSSDFAPQLAEALQGGSAAALAQESTGDSAKLVRDFFGNPGAGIGPVETQANLFLDSYENHLIFINIIVTVSPLLGLLGTILGMIRSFQVFDLKAGQPFAITSGIGEALIATAAGLVVAIIALILYGILKYRAACLSRQLMGCCALLEQYEGKGGGTECA